MSRITNEYVLLNIVEKDDFEARLHLQDILNRLFLDKR